MTIEPGTLVAIFGAIIGGYVFTFTAWRVTSNHLYTKLDKLNGALANNHLEVTNRLTALETTIKAARRDE